MTDVRRHLPSLFASTSAFARQFQIAPEPEAPAPALAPSGQLSKISTLIADLLERDTETVADNAAILIEVLEIARSLE